MQTNSAWFREAVFKVTRMHQCQVDDSSYHCQKLVEFLVLRMAWIYISYQIWKEFTRGKHTLNSTLKALAKPTGPLRPAKVLISF